MAAEGKLARFLRSRRPGGLHRDLMRAQIANHGGTVLGQEGAHRRVNVRARLLLVATAFAVPTDGSIVVEVHFIESVLPFDISDIARTRLFRFQVVNRSLVMLLLTASPGIG